MSIREFPRTEASVVEDVVNGWADEEHGVEIVGVEIFDHPEAAHSERYGCITGPWVAGPRAEVDAWLAERGHEDFTIQHQVAFEEATDVP